MSTLRATPRVEIFALSESGLFCSSIALGAWPKARRQLDRCDVFSVRLSGDLAEGGVSADAGTPLILPPPGEHLIDGAP